MLPRRDENQGPGIAARQVKLTWEDGQAIAQNVPGIRLITPLIVGRAQVKYRDRQHRPDFVFGVNEDWPEVANHTVDRGRFFSQIDLEHRRKVVGDRPEGASRSCGLGATRSARRSTSARLPVTVIGVMEKRGQSLGQDIDDLVVRPLRHRARPSSAATPATRCSCGSRRRAPRSVEQVKDGITRLLRQRHRIAEDQPDDFQVLLQDEILRSVDSRPRHASPRWSAAWSGSPSWSAASAS